MSMVEYLPIMKTRYATVKFNSSFRTYSIKLTFDYSTDFTHFKHAGNYKAKVPKLIKNSNMPCTLEERYILDIAGECNNYLTFLHKITVYIRKKLEKEYPNLSLTNSQLRNLTQSISLHFWNQYAPLVGLETELEIPF